MIILKTELNKEDYEFLVAEMKMMIQQRENRKMSQSNQKDFQEKTLDKVIVPLAERGQIEAMQQYCERLSPLATLNTKIVSNFHKLEQKNVKEPREFLALSAFYGWFVEYYKSTYKSVDVESLEEYRKAREYYRKAGQQLFQLGKTDPIAKESAFLLQKKNKELLPQEEYLRTMSNSRNQIFATANRQTNDNPRLKLLVRYCQNLINFAPDHEFIIHHSTVTTVLATVQKRMLLLDEMRR